MYGRGKQNVQFGDGIITQLDTFQKLYGQAELRTTFSKLTGKKPGRHGIGIFYVFKNELSNKPIYSIGTDVAHSGPRKRLSEQRYEQHKELLEEFISDIAELGRVPFPDEFARATDVKRIRLNQTSVSR